MIVFLLVLLITGNLSTEGKRLLEPDYGLQPNMGAVLGCYKAEKQPTKLPKPKSPRSRKISVHTTK
jgi:hypothetical protein